MVNTIDIVKMKNHLFQIGLLILLVSFYSCQSFHLQCQDDGFYPHPEDCRKFYRCAHGQRFSFECGPGTHYNPSLMVCDWPYNSGCLNLSNRQDFSSQLDSESETSATSVERVRYVPQSFSDYNQRRQPYFSSITNNNNFEYLDSSDRRFQSPHTNQNVPSNPQKQIYFPPIRPTSKIQFGDLIKPKNENNQKIILDETKPNSQYSQVSTHQIYYDPETGIYHQFHYKPRFQYKSNPVSYNSNGPKTVSDNTRYYSRPTPQPTNKLHQEPQQLTRYAEKHKLSTPVQRSNIHTIGTDNQITLESLNEKQGRFPQQTFPKTIVTYISNENRDNQPKQTQQTSIQIEPESFSLIKYPQPHHNSEKTKTLQRRKLVSARNNTGEYFFQTKNLNENPYTQAPLYNICNQVLIKPQQKNQTVYENELSEHPSELNVYVRNMNPICGENQSNASPISDKLVHKIKTGKTQISNITEVSYDHQKPSVQHQHQTAESYVVYENKISEYTRSTLDQLEDKKFKPQEFNTKAEINLNTRHQEPDISIVREKYVYENEDRPYKENIQQFVSKESFQDRQETIQPRKYPDLDASNNSDVLFSGAPDVILVDNRKFFDRHNQSIPITSIKTTPKPYGPFLKQSKTLVSPSSSISKQEKELKNIKNVKHEDLKTNKLEDNKNNNQNFKTLLKHQTFPSNKTEEHPNIPDKNSKSKPYGRSTNSNKIKKFEDEEFDDPELLDKIYDTTSSPQTNLSRLHEKIRDFIATFNPNALLIDHVNQQLDQEFPSSNKTTTVITTTENPQKSNRLESYVLYENETKSELRNQFARLIGLKYLQNYGKQDNLKSKINAESESSLSDPIQECNDEGDSWNDVCSVPLAQTKSNFQWIQVSDQSLHMDRSKLIQTKLTEALEDCQELCWHMLSNCVGFTYDRISQECHLAYEIEMDSIDSLLNLSQGARKINFLERKPRSTSSFLKPRWHLAYDQSILVGENLVPKFAESFFESEDLNMKLLNTFKMKNQLYGQLSLTKTFFKCIERCMKPTIENCRYVLYYQPTGLCLIEQKEQSNFHDSNTDKNDDEITNSYPKILSEKFVLRTGWSIGLKKDEYSNEEKKYPNQENFLTETKPIFFHLFEQLLVGEDSKFFLGRYLEPKHSLNNVDVQQCQNECIAMLHNCRFIAIYANLLWQDNSKNHSSTISCLFFSEDLIQILFKLMINKQENILSHLKVHHRNSYSHVNDTDSLLIIPQVRRRRSELHESDHVNIGPKEESRQADIEGKFKIYAYVFDTPEPFLKFRILHSDTIKDSERIISPPYQEWYDVTSEDQCYRQCSNSWLTFSDNDYPNVISEDRKDHLDAFNSNSKVRLPPCRFLVIKSFQSKFLKRFNCTFYELSPIAFTEQSWYTVRKIPDHFPMTTIDVIDDFFFESDFQHDNNTMIRLLDESMTAVNRHECLIRCLQTLIFNGSVRHCFKVHIGRLKSGHFKCRFYDRVTNEKSTSKLFRLRYLPYDTSSTFSSIPSYGYLEFFDPISIEESPMIHKNQSSKQIIEQILNKYEPLYVLDKESNPNNCLRLCILLWGRIRPGHSDPDRCRLIFVKLMTSAENNVDDPELLGKTKYRCMIYDLDLKDQVAQTNQRRRFQKHLSQYPVKIYRVPSPSLQNYNNSTGFQIHNSKSRKPELIMQLDLTNYTSIFESSMNYNSSLDNVTNRALYHFSSAQSPQDCIRVPPRHRTLSNQKGEQKHRLIIAKPMFVNDPILPGRIVYECLYYYHFPMEDLIQSMDFSLKQTKNQEYSEVLAYQLVDTGTYDYVDPHSESIRFVRESYQPILTAKQNISKVEDCLHRCSEFNYYQTDRFVQCQLVVIEPNRRIQDITKDFRCIFYNFNVSSVRYFDLDSSEFVEFYRLRSVPIVTRFDSDQVKYETFERINRTEEIQSISEFIVQSQRQAFWHLSNITDRRQCFDRCLRTWESKLLYFNNPSILSSKSSSLVHSNFCRMILVIPVIGNQRTYECAFYETNVTHALKSFEIFLGHSDVRVPKEPKEFFGTEDDGFYMTVEWPLVSPQVTDQTMMLSHPVDLNHCLRECDRKPMDRCQALVTRYKHNQLIRCYFIGMDEYLPDFINPPLPNHQSKLSIKLFNVYDKLPTKPTRTSTAYVPETLNPYLAIIDSLRNYQQNLRYISRMFG